MADDTSAKRPTKQIGEMLIEAGLITRGQLEGALARQGQEKGRVVEILISQGHLSAEGFTRFLAKNKGIPSIDLGNYEVPQELLALVPREFAQQNEVFPIDKMGSLLTVAMVCPLDERAIARLHTETGLRIKPMLCRGDDIRQAINRYYGDDAAPTAYTLADMPGAPSAPPKRDVAGLATPLKFKSIVELIRGVTQLPALPETVESVRRATQDPTVGIAEVAGVINRDPGVAARVLGVANSAAYGFPNRIGTLDLAISLIGLRETYSIVLAASVVDMFSTSKIMDYRLFWKQSIHCAEAALQVGAACGQRRKSSLFTAGLLHGIGRIALAEVAPERYGKISQDLPLDQLIAREEEELGIPHTEAGYELVTHWNLPPEIGQVVRYYPRPEAAETGKDFVACVSIAHAMAQAEAADDFVALAGCGTAFGLTGLTEEKACAIQRDYFEKKRNSVQFDE